MNSQQIFDIENEDEFADRCLRIFRHQASRNKVYADFIDLLGISPENIDELRKIPFLPIQFFKSHQVVVSPMEAEAVFTSSGTTGSVTSRHVVGNLNLYRESVTKAFNLFYGPIENYTILALLPSYLERKGSSLVYMADELIRRSDSPDSGFYLNNLQDLSEKLQDLDKKGEQILLLGVSFALLDLIGIKRFKLKNTIVMETGGMKGKRKEMVREELHRILKHGFGVDRIHSEYGMTELLSQAYSDGEGVFTCPPWMKISIRDPEDPFSYLKKGRTGGVNVIDLANFNSCSFIATQDLGRIRTDGSFEIVGRFDHSDIRGCNLMIV